MQKVNSPADMPKIREFCQAAFARQKLRFLVCAGTGCIAGGSLEVYEEFKRMIGERGIDVNVELLFEDKEIEAGTVTSGCHGFCQAGPLVRAEPEGTFYTKVKAKDVEEIVTATLDEKTVVERLLYEKPDGTHATTEKDVPFYNRQQRIVLGGCGTIDPEDIREYFAVDGFQALATIFQEHSQEDVIEIVKASGLRGRGGGGFPAGRKWEAGLNAKATPKYVVCNGDEGDPGAFMDRSVLEANPQSVIEGMTIAGYAIGARQGIVYLRA